jgi:capsular exopolysaccharide synthesis family protein
MSQEIVQSSPRTLAVAEDTWGAGSSAMPPAAGGAGVAQPLQKVHRLLRGRYLLAGLLALLGGVAGAYYGWKSQAPVYRASGMIEIKPFIPRIAESDKVMPFYNQHMTTEAGRIRTAEVIDVAMRTPEWRDAGGPAPTPQTVAGFQSGLLSTVVKNSFYIDLTFEHTDPKLAGAGVNAVLSAFRQTYDVKKGADAQAKIEQVTDQRDVIVNRISEKERAINTIAQPYGTNDLQKIYESQLELLSSHKRALMGIDANLAAAQDVKKIAAEQGSGLSLSDLSQIDRSGLMRKRLEQMQELELRLDNMANMGRNNPTVQILTQQIANLQKVIDDQAADMRKTTYGLMPDLSGTGASIVVTQQMIDQLQSRAAYLRGQLGEVEQQFRKIAEDRYKIDTLNTEIRKLKSDFDAAQTTIDGLVVQSVLSGTPGITGAGNSPAISADKRRTMALAGFGLGSALPVLGVLLLGLFDNRFRYSDDAGGQVSGLNLLGILPNLPDRLSDPQQASIAAHCVHQIRTMLQLNMMHDEPTAMCITSAASGDGKTSLSLALGLSFAASGSRTLMIDADLVGGGLSNRLAKGESATGILEALTTGRLLEFIRTTDVQDLAILPVGQAHVQHAGVFSPTAMRRLINEAKKHFEVILIDTGPLMGAIEATPVCAAVDGVILAVSRGQSRPLVERSLEHLRNIGARIAGVVFNRAQAKDFARSISGMSVRSAARSAANGQGHNRRVDPASAIGPVANAVRSDVGNEGR